jgi:hypothetical protein
LNVFQQKYRKHFELCDELLSLALQASPWLPDPSQTYGEVITAFFIKALSSFRGVILLCEAGFGYEAGLIVRSLLNLSILVKWTEQEKEERAYRFLGWFWKQRTDYIKSTGKTATAIGQAAWDKVKHLFKKTDQYWYGKTRIRQLAASLKEDTPPPDGYGSWAELHYVKAYTVLSDIEHSNPIASSAFLARAKGRYLIGYLSSDEAIHEALKDTVARILRSL